MTRIFLLLAIIVFTACNPKPDSDQQAPETENTEGTDKIRQSKTYKSYVMAHADYQDCIDQKPKMTDQLMNNEISREEYNENIKINNRVCRLKRTIVKQYWQVLAAEHENITSDYRLHED